MRYLILVLLIMTFREGEAQASDTLPLPEPLIKAQDLHDRQLYYEALIEAEGYLDRGARIDDDALRHAALAHNLVGDCHLELGSYDAAIINYRRSRQIVYRTGNDQQQLADVLNKIGNYHLEVKEYQLALSYLDSAQQIRKEVFGASHVKVADVYNNLGVAYLNLRDFAKALGYHQEALRIRSLHERDKLVAQSLNNLGQSYHEMNDPQNAKDAFDKAIAIYSRPLYHDANLLADVWLNLGNLQYDLDEFSLAINQYNRALYGYQQTSGPTELARALCYNNIANAYTRKEEYGKAFHFYEQALTLRKEKLGQYHPDIAQTLYNMALNYFYQDRTDEAENTLTLCAEALYYDPENDKDFLQVNDHWTLLNVLYLQVESALISYSETQETATLLQAFSQFEQIDRLIDYFRVRYDAVGSKRDFVETSHLIYGKALELSMILYQQTKEEKYWHMAFKYAEKSKGVLLLEALQKAKAESFLGIPDDVIRAIKQTESTIGQLEKRKYLLAEGRATNQQKLDSLSASIFSKNEALSAQIESLGATYPAYYNLRYETTPPTVAYVQTHLLTDTQSVVAYFLGEADLSENTKLWIFVINGNDFQAREIELPPLFFMALNDLKIAIRNFPHVASKDVDDNVAKYIRSAALLYDYLLRPIKHLLREQIILIPDGQLGFVSFDALLSSPVDSMHHFRDHPYLVKDYMISYNYSIRLFKEMMERKGRTSLRPYLGMAPEFSEEKLAGLSPLNHNNEEVLAAREELGGRVYLKGKARKERFLEEQSKYKVIHLATHGMAHPTRDDFSFLAFSGNGKEPLDESLLYVKEIYNLSTNAEMVVLSACETGAGRLVQGEGIASIARSFSFAGAKSLLATRWNVNDKTTKDLMSLFFSKIKKGSKKDVALHQAINGFIETSSHHHAHPFYWASFMALGNMESINLHVFPIEILALLTGLVVLMAIFYTWRRRSLKPSS